MSVQLITLLGSTGSIGQSALDVIRSHSDRFEVYALVAGRNVELLIKQVQEFKPVYAILNDKSKLSQLKSACAGLKTKVFVGSDAIADIAKSTDVDIVISAMVGAAGLKPTLNAIQVGHRVAIANKEPLVMAGEYMINTAKKTGAVILPIDSEHSAIFQSVVGSKLSEVSKIRLTASGGPFRGKTKAELSKVSIADALNHPTWNMGPKITIDSASLMNKALEVIEAHWLFDMPANKIAVTVHPQSLIHSMVEYNDGSIIAQMGLPDMRVPIQYALSWPDRWQGTTDVPNLAQVGNLIFEDVDHDTFPSIKLAWEVCDRGGVAGAVLNAANEVAVERFLKNEISFLDIFELVKFVVNSIKSGIVSPDLDVILEADKEARDRARIWKVK